MLVARVVAPGAGFVASQGTNDADWLMLGGFGTTAGERTRPHFEALLARAGLRLESLTPVRGIYSVLVAAPAGAPPPPTPTPAPEPAAAAVPEAGAAGAGGEEAVAA
jgi:hypothetical protein